MKKQLLVLLLSSTLLSSCDSIPNLFNKKTEDPYTSNSYQMKVLEAEKVTVSFYYNFNRQEFELNSGMSATANSIAFKVDQINAGEKVSKPETDPVRENYQFDGWHTSSTEDSPFNFETAINSNTVLYAHWIQVKDEEFVEPEYIEPSKIDDSINELVSITGVLNFELEGNSVKLPNSGIYRLMKDKLDVVSCLNYKIKTGVELVATYDVEAKLISYSATKGEESLNGSISVINNSANLIVNNSTYEEKAKSYEDGSIQTLDHKIMLAGSSSMENWKTSTVDLLPLTTYNHGIGGTTAHQWRDCLNQRLVYPYSPKTVVYYVGVNNLINTKDTVEETNKALVEMFDDVHEHLPNTKIYYVLINDLPGYPTYKDQIHSVNDAVKEYEQNHDFLITLDAGSLLLNSQGEPNKVYFLSDGLHMSLAGYALWGNYIKNKLIEDMKE